MARKPSKCNPIGTTLAETKTEARRLAAKGNTEGWMVVVGRLRGVEGKPYSIRFQEVPKRERLAPGVTFDPITPYTSYKSNPTIGSNPNADAIAEQVSKGKVYFGESLTGRPLSVGPYKASLGRPRFAVFVADEAVRVGTATQAARYFMASVKPSTVQAALDNPLGWRTPMRPAPGAAHVDWKQVAQLVNAKLESVDTSVYASPSKRALKWFKRYQYPSTAAYSISRTEARRLLDHVGIDLDAMVAQAIEDSFGPYAVNPVREVPEKVERYFAEAMEQPGMTEPKAWAVAWSRYCKYTEPQSKHCKLRQAEYFPGRKGKGSRGAGKCRPKKIILNLLEGMEPEQVVLTPSSAGSDLFKRADTQLKKWAMKMPAGDMWKTDFQIEFEGNRPYEGRIDLSRDWVRQENVAAHVKEHLTLIAGRGAPASMSSKQYADYLREIDPTGQARDYAIDLLDNCDIGSSRPKLPTKLTEGQLRKLPSKPARAPRKRSSSPRKPKSAPKPKSPSRPKSVRAKSDRIRGGLADEGAPIGVDPKQVEMGIKVEMEHTDDPVIAREIAYDHLTEDPRYYDKLATIEDDEHISNFEVALQKFLHHAQRLVPKGVEISIDRGPRYIRVVRQDGSSTSVYAFVDRKTGDILKSAGWKGPAKGRRGNIYSGNYGVTEYGASYYSEPKPKRRRAPSGSLIRYVIVDVRDGSVKTGTARSEQEARKKIKDRSLRVEWPVDEVSAIVKSKAPSKRSSPRKAPSKKRTSPKKARIPGPWDMLSIGQTVENDKWRIHRWATSLSITSLLNAGKRGKKVPWLHVHDPSDRLVAAVLKAAKGGASVAQMRKTIEAMGADLDEYEHRGIDVLPAQAKSVSVDGVDFHLSSSQGDFSVAVRDFNETRCMPPMRAPKTAIKKMFAWASKNESKIPNMTFSQLTKALRSAGIHFHQYCGMD